MLTQVAPLDVHPVADPLLVNDDAIAQVHVVHVERNVCDVTGELAVRVAFEVDPELFDLRAVDHRNLDRERSLMRARVRECGDEFLDAVARERNGPVHARIGCRHAIDIGLPGAMHDVVVRECRRSPREERRHQPCGLVRHCHRHPSRNESPVRSHPPLLRRAVGPGIVG